MALETQLADSATRQAHTATPEQTATEVPPPSLTPMLFQVTQIRPLTGPTLTPLPTNPLIATVEVRGSTPVPSPTGIDQRLIDDSAIAQFQPPPEEVPLSLQPFDHFFFRRPVDASANSRSIFYYPYGGRWEPGGPRVHHGVDMPNDIGQQVLAAGSGTVVWSGQSNENIRVDSMEVYSAYGNFIVIKHDFAYERQDIYTLYAHLSALLVDEGAYVEMGEVVGLVGDTGLVTGAHVHFEVRLGVNDYWNTRNPLLWIAPYLDHGVIAGRVVDAAGQFVDEVSLQLYRGGRVADRTVTYAQPLGGRSRSHHVVPDDNWQENFVFGDVPAGQYQVVATVQGRQFRQNVDVQPRIVNWVEFQINPPAETE